MRWSRWAASTKVSFTSKRRFVVGTVMRARASDRVKRRRTGDDDDEIVIDGMTRRELKEKAGW